MLRFRGPLEASQHGYRHSVMRNDFLYIKRTDFLPSEPGLQHMVGKGLRLKIVYSLPSINNMIFFI